jgi:glycosyltransferase involved in cell wall biosynthesis
MKLKFISPYHNNLKDFIREISIRNNFTFFIPEKEKELLESENINFEYLNFDTSTVFGFTLFRYNLIQVWKNIDKEDDYIFVKHLFQPFNWLIFLVCKLKGVGVCVYHQDSRYIPRAAKYLLRGLFKLITPKNFKGFAITKDGAEQIKNYISKAIYLPIPIDESKFAQRKVESREELNIICVAKLDQTRKNHKLLIESLEQFKKQNPEINFKLTLIGATKKTENYHQLIDRVNSSNISDLIEIKKNLEYDKMKEVYSNHDILILPAKSEPLGFVILEAMASGLPVICSDECGAKSYIEEEGNGYVFDLKRKEKSITNALEKFLDEGKINWKKINRFGNKSLEKVKKEHDPQKNISTLLGLLEDF